MDKIDWDEDAPEGFEPTPEMIEKFIADHTAPDGVLEIDLDREPGWRTP